MEEHAFSTRLAFERELEQCFARARKTLDMFDADFSLWQLGAATVDAELRRFLAGKGHIRMLAHDDAWLKLHCPRFLRLLLDFGHAIECRITHPNQHHLTDSFCVADDLHAVRRFHRDHARGVATFDAASSASLCSMRFNETWRQSSTLMHTGTTGV